MPEQAVPDREVKVTLVKALHLIEDPSRWVVGAECQIVERHANHKPVFGYCSVGAVRAAITGYELPPNVDAEAINEGIADGDPVECTAKKATKRDEAVNNAAMVALGEALQDLDYRDVWEDPWDTEPEHDPDTARDTVVDFNDSDAEHESVVNMFKRAIEQVAARMRSK